MSSKPRRLTEAEINDRCIVARDIVGRAADLALHYWNDLGSLEIRNKGVQDVVSQADVRTEELIRADLAAAFPTDAFLGEETGAEALDTSDAIWVVDPIDGTQPFLLGLPTWGVSVALVTDGQVVLGFLACPAAGEFFEARRGTGATMNDRPIHVLNASLLSDGLTTVGCSMRTSPADVAGMMERLLTNGGMFHRSGSGAIGLAYVAAGRMIGYIEQHINSWDCLAALLLIEEAGGRVSDFIGENGLVGGGPLIAGAPGVYEALQELMPTRHVASR